MGLTGTLRRVLRGGSWNNNNDNNLRVANRNRNNPSNTNNNNGFRLVAAPARGGKIAPTVAGVYGCRHGGCAIHAPWGPSSAPGAGDKHGRFRRTSPGPPIGEDGRNHFV